MLFLAISQLLASTCLGSKLCTDTTRLILNDTEPFISLVVFAGSRASFLCRPQCTKPSTQHSSSGAMEEFRKTLSVQANQGLSVRLETLVPKLAEWFEFFHHKLHAKFILSAISWGYVQVGPALAWQGMLGDLTYFPVHKPYFCSPQNKKF